MVSVSYGSAGSVSADPALSDDLHRSHMLAGVPTGATPIVPELRVMRARGEGEQRATFF
jgi:hypothetical protein